MEKSLKIKTQDGKFVYAILNGSISKPLIVIVHGLCGHMNEALHYNAVRYFKEKGFSCLRFNLYSWGKDARKLHQCNLKTHGKDIDTVLKYLKRKGVKKVYLVGHSYGLPSILNSERQNVRAIVSWDGSHLPRRTFERLPKINKPKGRIYDEGYLTIMGESMVREEPIINSDALISKVNSPILFVTIADGYNLKGAKRMYRKALGEKRLLIMKGADHNFNNEGKQELLYAATVNWFKKYV